MSAPSARLGRNSRSILPKLGLFACATGLVWQLRRRIESPKIVKCLDLPSLPCTLPELGRGAASAPSTVQMWCRAVDIHARDVVLFARGLWAIYWAATLDVAPNDLLQYAEKRTMQNYLKRSGPLGDQSRVVSVEAFCARQTLLVHKQVLAEVLRLTSERADGKSIRSRQG